MYIVDENIRLIIMKGISLLYKHKVDSVMLGTSEPASKLSFCDYILCVDLSRDLTQPK